MSNFMDELKKSTDRVQNNVSVTENGAIGYKTSGKALIDCNFMLSSMRNMDGDEIWSKFLLAYNENPTLALIWLFFARDREEGCGERRTFRLIFRRLCDENEDVAVRLIGLVPFYGRWDDVVFILCSGAPLKVRDRAFRVISEQLDSDIRNEKLGNPVSLLAKWLPSLNTSSDVTRKNAEIVRERLGWTPRQYRKTVSRLRQYLKVVERKMSANEWGKIDYSAVPSKAAMNYRNAFARHDGERYEQYLADVKEGKTKINSGVLYPYDIVHAYGHKDDVDTTLEEQWKALPNKVPENDSTLVVVDGSGSMLSPIGGTHVTCMDVARSLGIYFAEKLKGPYYNSFITFSSRPQYVHFADGLTLCAKIGIMDGYDDCSNTDIEKVFNLILDTAVKNRLLQSEIPSNILIVSDMEFDDATYRGGYGWGRNGGYAYGDECPGAVDQALFTQISERFAKHGYQLPRLVFWNVCSRTGTIPVTTNNLGVALLSGFSPSIADMVMSDNLDPYQCLIDKLKSDRYKPVWDALFVL